VNLETAVQHIKQKQIADAPVGTYEQKPITKGKGRFGPYIKWDGMFVNVPRRYDFDNLTQAEMDELLDAKVKKEANRYIQRWPDEKISVENARWGPVLKFNKKILKLSLKADGTKYTADEAALIPLEDIKTMITAQVPNAFGKKKSAPKKKAASVKKKPAKKKKKE
jgi:DNA topoisomerase-1